MIMNDNEIEKVNVMKMVMIMKADNEIVMKYFSLNFHYTLFSVFHYKEMSGKLQNGMIFHLIINCNDIFFITLFSLKLL